MKVFKRVLIKLLILLLVIGISGGGAACYQASRQSTADYAMDHYLALLIDNSVDKAYSSLDQSEAQELTKAEYEGALEAKKYSLYDSYQMKEAEKRRDNNGNEYVDYDVTFQNAAGEEQASERFTVKKQSAQIMGLFDRWKVLSEHCMVKNFLLTVPDGSEVYLDAEQADASWLVTEDVPASCDRYQIPTLIPGKISLVIRHPALESVNTTLDATTGSADYTEKMPLKEDAKSACTELGVKLLKAVYVSAVKNQTDDPDKLLAECQKQANSLIKKQTESFLVDGADFKNVAISNFAAQFGDPVFTEEKNGAITTEMTFSYHYVVREDVTTDTDEMLEDGTYAQQTTTQEQSGDATAKLTMAYYEDAWHIDAMQMDVIPK